jgi:hypothetical protein
MNKVFYCPRRGIDNMRDITIIIVILSFTIATAPFVLSSETKPASTEIIRNATDTTMAEKKENVPLKTTQVTPPWACKEFCVNDLSV